MARRSETRSIELDFIVRRDQRAVCFAPRAARRPVPLSTTPPVPLRPPRARHELAWCRAAGAAGFRLRPGGGVALRLRFARRCSPPSAPLAPPADHRPKPGFYRRGGRDARRDSACCSNNSRVRPTFAASADSLGNAVWYSRRAFYSPNLPSHSAPVRRFCRCSELAIGVFCPRETPGIRLL